MNLISLLWSVAIGLLMLIIGNAILLALQRRNFDPVSAIARVLSPADTASFEG